MDVSKTSPDLNSLDTLTHLKSYYKILVLKLWLQRQFKEGKNGLVAQFGLGLKQK